MCGIVGLAARDPKAPVILAGRGADALAALNHRGPDARGDYTAERVWLGHTRLSILDLSSAADQPMACARNRFVITYNGEVYNFRELATKNQLTGLRTGSDTEIVLELFARLGTGSLPLLNGMFAFAIFDSQEQKLWLVRDRLGIKPLYYRLTADRLYFGSEIKAIAALEARAPGCDYAGLHEWLYYGNPLGARTMHDGIRQLLPGQYLEVDLSSFRSRTESYWSLTDQADRVWQPDGRSLEETTRSLLEDAVRRQLVSDVPIGIFLSGGIDSSAITAFASRHYPGKLATFSAAFDFSEDDGELPVARAVARQFSTEHHELRISGADIADVVRTLVHQHDMPFADAANIPLYLMSRQLGNSVKVVLQGDGGDELFGGYRRYSTLNYLPILARLARAAKPALGLLSESPLRYRTRRYLEALCAGETSRTMALLLTQDSPLDVPERLFLEPVRRLVQASDPFARYTECQSRVRHHDRAKQMSLVDLMIVLPDTFLQKVDRACMATSLETRVPFLDNDLVDFAVSLDGQARFPMGRKKWLLKRALRGIVPEEVLGGRKRGLTVPYGRWLMGPLRDFFFDNLAKLERSDPDVVDGRRVRELYERTSTGRQNHSALLWKSLQLAIWINAGSVRLD